METIRVGLFFGGIDQERLISVNTAQAIRRHLDSDRYHVVDIEIKHDKGLYYEGRKSDLKTISKQIDVALLATHGAFGEDGKLQRELDEHAIPYTGSDSVSASIAFSKLLTKQMCNTFDIQTPLYEFYQRGDIPDKDTLAKEIFVKFPQPCVIKPATSGSSLGVSICEDVHEIAKGLEQACLLSDIIIVEEYIPGCELTVGVIERFRDQDLYVLPAVEITLSSKHTFHTFESKYDGEAKEICPAVLQDDIRDSLNHIAQEVHKHAHLRGYSRTDFMVHSKRGIFVLEVNSLPALGADMPFRKELDAVGIPFAEFLDHIITNALSTDHV